MSLSITDVARAAGVPTSTLRYYDRLGLLASDGRADNGYRRYDDRALDRLRFIGRAKELGCTLDEIGALLTAFDDDCGDVQLALRELVDDKIRLAQNRVAELVAFTAQLQETRHALAADPASGPCGPGCACVDSATPSGRLLTVVPVGSEPDIVCTLGHEEVGDRIAEWQAVLAHVATREALDGGIRLTLDREVDIGEVSRLARAEWSCCSFFSFAITVDGRGTALEVRAPETARELLTSVFGSAA
jgi:MerR family copper efflux transcriptional regulator